MGGSEERRDQATRRANQAGTSGTSPSSRCCSQDKAWSGLDFSVYGHFSFRLAGRYACEITCAIETCHAGLYKLDPFNGQGGSRDCDTYTVYSYAWKRKTEGRWPPRTGYYA
jgi:hypothetical protein